ncbi:MAG: uvrD2, partial [Acidimicrobiia bacterium]|nr:uvrD2 [Acidimicrobiia bacterium]
MLGPASGDQGPSIAAMQDLLGDLDDAQRRAVTIEAAPLAILAGAGSGKTRVLTRRIAHRVATGTADASHTVVLTFTRRASAELSHRLLSLGLRERVVCGTLHSVAWSVLQQRWLDQGRRPLTLLDQPGRILAPIIRQAAVRIPVDELVAEIDWARARLIAPDDYAGAARGDQRRTTLPPQEIAELYATYEKTKRAKRLVDFADLLSHCAGAIDRDREFAEVMRWRFRHFFVDEFQDMNPLQFRLVRTWLGARRDLCVVGDPNQSIYGWNGADHQLLQRFSDHFPDATTVRLDANYRCSRPILLAASAVLPDDTHPHPVIESGPTPSIHAYANEHLEAAGI